ncbi:TPA: hypothetical protein RMI67_003210 [Bacillus cereus]|nr:hypothetical protein [Bacillus cereus]
MPETNPEVSRIMERFKKAKSKRQKKDNMWKTLDSYNRNEVWEVEGNLPPWMPRPNTNFIHLVSTTKKAALAVEDPIGKLYPVSPEEIREIEMLNKIYEFVWKKIKVSSTLREIIGTSKLLGTGILHMFWNESGVHGGKGTLYKGEIEVCQVEPSCFYPDPNAFTLEDCDYIHIVERKSLSWVKERFGKDAEESKQNAEMGEIFHRDYESEENEKIVDFHTHYEKVVSGQGKSHIKVTYIAGAQVVHTIEAIEPNVYPFVMIYDFKQRHDFWAMSVCEYILDNQRILNKVEAIITMIGVLLQNPQKVVTKESGINPTELKKFGNAPSHVWITSMPDPSRAIYHVIPPQIPQSLFNLYETAKANIREITGLNEAYLGENVGSLQTSQGVNSLIERATMRDRDQLKDLEDAVENITRLLVAFITTKYDAPRFIRISGSTPDEYEFQEFVGKDYFGMEYDYSINVSQKAPITRMRQSQEAKELLNLQGQFNFEPAVITTEEYIQDSDLINKEQRIERMKMDRLNNQVEKSAQVINECISALQGGALTPEQIPDFLAQRYQEIEAEKSQEQHSNGTGNTGGGPMGEFQKRQQGVNLQ